MRSPVATSHRSEHVWRDQRGASAVEYGLLIAGIAAIIVAAVFVFGGGVQSLFVSTCSTVGGHTSQTCS